MGVYGNVSTDDTDRGYAGGIVGYTNGSSYIANCVSGVAVSGQCAGGIVGSNGKYIVNCYSTGTVSGRGNAGGIAGSNDGGTIANCYSISTVSGGGNYGMIAGYNTSGTVNPAYYLKGDTDAFGYGSSGTLAYYFESPGSNVFATANGADQGKDLVTALNGNRTIIESLLGGIGVLSAEWTVKDGVNDGYPVFNSHSEPPAAPDATHTHDNVSFDTEWSSNMNEDTTISASQNIVLTNNVNIDGNLTISGSGTVVNLCLNDKLLYLYSGKHITVGAGATLNIYDCGMSGKLNGSYKEVYDGLIDTSGTVNIYGGTIQNGNNYGRTIFVNTSGKLTVSGGTVKKDSSSTGGGSAVYCHGGTVNITGGTVDGGQYDHGLFLHGGTASITGGTVTSGVNDSKYYAVINQDGVLTIGAAAQISNTGKNEAIYIQPYDNTAETHITGGSITAANNAAISIVSSSDAAKTNDVYLSGSPTIQGGTGKADIYIGTNTSGKITAKLYATAAADSGSATYTGALLELDIARSTAFMAGQTVVTNSVSTDSFQLLDGNYNYYLAADNGNLVLAKPHVHDWAVVWSSNATHHWHECLNPNCDITVDSAKDGYAAHSFSVPDHDATQHWNKCSVCSAADTRVNHTYDQTVASETYKKSDATCTSPAVYYKSCACGQASTTDTFESGVSLGHTMTHHAAVAATCHATGTVEYWSCSVCSKNYGDERGATKLDTIVAPIDPNNHKAADTWTQENGKHYHECLNGCGIHLDEADCSGGTATCTEKAVCSVCDNAYGEANGHTMAKVDAVAATCHATGTVEHWHCSVCNKNYSDQGGATKLDTIVAPIDPNNHKAADTWKQENGKHYHECLNGCGTHLDEADCSGGTATCAEKAVCSVCDNAYGEANGHTMAKVDAVAATCHATGTVEHWHCSVCNKNYSDQGGATKLDTIVAPIDPNNHKAADTWKQENGKHYHECLNGCGTHLDEADCSGGTATCAEKAVCSVCDNAYGEANGHTMAKVDAVAATCHATGTVEHWHCSVCNKNYSDQGGANELATIVEPINSTNHKAAATWTQADDKHYHVCENGCGTHLDEATCSGGTAACGTQATCEVCHNQYGDVDANAHNWNTEAWSNNDTHHWHDCLNANCPVADNASKNGYAEHKYDNAADTTCNDCDYVRTVSEYVITFNSGEGTVDLTSAVTENGGKLTTLPTPTRSGYRFNGWYTAETGGEKVTTGTVFGETTTIYAQWTKISSGGGVTTYSIAVDKTENGKVSPSKTYASAGLEITLTVLPEENYKLASIRVTDSKDNEIALTAKNDGTYSFKMPSSNITVKAEFVKVDSVADCTGDETCPAYPFTDLDLSKWYHDGIHYCVENGFMQGLPGNLFAPNATTTRGMIVTILYRLEGEPTVSGVCPFSDVNTGSWYEDAITWAATNKIVEGYGNDKYGPEDAITREQMAAIIYRYAEYKGYNVADQADLSKFTDNGEISNWAETALCWANANNLVEGDGSKLMPTGNAARCQVAAILHRFCENVAE